MIFNALTTLAHLEEYLAGRPNPLPSPCAVPRMNVIGGFKRACSRLSIWHSLGPLGFAIEKCRQDHQAAYQCQQDTQG
jgi:hypothetical protein